MKLITTGPWVVLALSLVLLGSSKEPRLDAIERGIKRYKTKDFKQLGVIDTELTKSGKASLWVNEASIDGMAVAIVNGEKKRDKVFAYFEIHHLEIHGWDVLVRCYGDQSCRRTRLFNQGARGRVRKQVGGPADMFYGVDAPKELNIPGRYGVSAAAIREAQRYGLHQAAILRMYRTGFDGPSMQLGFKFEDEALAAVVRGMESQVPFKVGKANVAMWKEQDFACAYFSMEPAFDFDSFRREVAKLDADFSKRMERYFPPLPDLEYPDNPPAATGGDDLSDVSGDDIAVDDGTLPTLPNARDALAWFEGTWDVLTRLERDPTPMESVEVHHFQSGRWDTVDSSVEGRVLRHMVRGYDENRGKVLAYRFDELSPRPLIAEGSWDPKTLTLVLEGAGTQWLSRIVAPHVVETTVRRQSSDGTSAILRTETAYRRK